MMMGHYIASMNIGHDKLLRMKFPHVVRVSTAWCKKNSCMFEFPAFLPPVNLGLPMHSPSALTEHVSLILARFFLLDPVEIAGSLHTKRADIEPYRDILMK